MVYDLNQLRQHSARTEAILCPPFEWCFITGGNVILLDASEYGGTRGGTYQVPDFAVGKYLITNGQYQTFIEHPNGFHRAQWWEFSSQATQWRKDHAHPKPPAFAGRDLPCTRVSWFDSVAFCNWLSTELNAVVRLPTEQEWQRAAVGDTGWSYPWGNEFDENRGNFTMRLGTVSVVGSFPDGQSPFGVMDMIGNLSEWCLTTWATDSTELAGYTYRVIRGCAWNAGTPEYLRATDRGLGWSPRGRLNDCGFRIVLELQK